MSNQKSTLMLVNIKQEPDDDITPYIADNIEGNSYSKIKDVLECTEENVKSKVEHEHLVHIKREQIYIKGEPGLSTLVHDMDSNFPEKSTTAVEYIKEVVKLKENSENLMCIKQGEIYIKGEPACSDDKSYKKPHFLSASKTKIGQHSKPFKMCSNNGQKTFQCNTCNFKTIYRNNLIKHIRAHTGEIKRPYACDSCDFKATRKFHLTRHLTIHTGERPFACNLCKFRSATKCNLRAHMRIHTRGKKWFACILCDFKTLRKSSLRAHTRLHTGKKPHECDMCGFKCMQTSVLRIHKIKSHAQAETFTCTLCNLTTTRKASLTKHMNSCRDVRIKLGIATDV